jgi:hypothetical protein
MDWRVWVGVALLMMSCSSTDVNFTESEGRIEVSPVLRDLGPVPVGSTYAFDLQVDHLGGAAVELRNVVVNNTDAGLFAYVGEETSVAIERGATVQLPFVYSASRTGFHRATVDLTHTGKDSPLRVDVRANAVLPEVSVFPLAIDFGPASPGESVEHEVTIDNVGAYPLEISSGTMSNASFVFTDDTPISIQPGDARQVTLRFEPTSSSAVEGTFTLRLGEEQLPSVMLIGNDCLRGLPDLYDQDADGQTLCGGDCDDADASVREGLSELADRVDQDCDGLIDEGTRWADDDKDGYCEGPDACSDGAQPGDCHDGDADISPGQREDETNGVDDDCDGVVDLGTEDFDGDGFAPGVGGDCKDTDDTVHPGAVEIADGFDQNCDGQIDEGTAYADDDGDAYCEGPICSDSSTPGDCDDSLGAADTHPLASEVADRIDNDCDGQVDEGTEYADDDGDGFTEAGGDCDDTDPTNSPAYGDDC